MSDLFKLFQMNEYDVVVARNQDEAIQWYQQEYDNLDEDEIEEVQEVKSYQKKHWWIITDWNHLWGIIEKYGEMKISLFNGELAVFISYKNSLELYKYSVPEIFSSTEW